MTPDRTVTVSKLLVAVDGSWQSTTAAKLAAEVAKGLEAELTILHVVPAADSSRRGTEADDTARERGGRLLADAAAKVVRAAGVDAKVALRKGHVVDEILRFADQYKPDVIVMGSRGMSREKGLLLGSVSQVISQHAKCSVLIAR